MIIIRANGSRGVQNDAVVYPDGSCQVEKDPFINLEIQQFPCTISAWEGLGDESSKAKQGFRCRAAKGLRFSRTK